MICVDIAIIIIMIVIQVIIHELMHLAFARIMLKVRDYRIHIGGNHFVIKLTDKVTFTLIPIGGYVEFEKKYFANKSIWCIIAYFEIAPIVNLIIAILSYYLIKGKYGVYFSVIGFSLFLSSQFITQRSDFLSMCYMIHERIRRSN